MPFAISQLSVSWVEKWDKRLWIDPPFHLFREVVQKIKEDRTQGILVVPLWDWKPCWKDVLARLSIPFASAKKSSCMQGTTLVHCNSGCGLPYHSWLTEVSSLTVPAHQTMGQN